MREWDVNAASYAGSTALTWAAGRGQEEVVKMLFKRKDFNLNQADTKYGRTPLAWRAENGHSEIVKTLSEQ